jgi:NAD+ kinase
MNVAIYGRPSNPGQKEFVEQLLLKLEERHINWKIYKPFYNYLFPDLPGKKEVKLFTNALEVKSGVDFLLSVGGDGTLLDTVTLVQDSGTPILGINTGRLGFLANINQNDTNTALDSLMKGHYALDKRTLLRLESNNNCFGDTNFALNELTIHKKDSSSMMTIHAYLNGEFLNSYWADGLIISTPTGSTGYSLSCGGPILVPQSESFVINPIAPHNLNVRPIIVSDKNVISIEIEGRSQHFLASLDSRSETVDSSVQLAVRKEDFTINLVRPNQQNFLDTLRKKLMWGLDSRN